MRPASSWRVRSMLLLVAAPIALGCGDGEARPDGGGDTPFDQPFAYRACPADQKLGEIKVSLEKDFTAVGGSIAESVIAAHIPERVLDSDGCRLLRRRVFSCLPACLPGESCQEGGVCVRYPENASAGTITISGLAGPVRMVPRGVGRNYWDTSLPHPGFQPGADLVLRASGGDLPAFALRGWGVSALALPDQALRLEPGQPFELRWEPGPEGPALIQLTISVDQHGVTPTTLVCESADSGALMVPAALVTALLAAGTSGYSTAIVARRTVDAFTLPSGCAEFVVTTSAERRLTVAGHLPCGTTADCPPGKTCATQLQTCL